MFRSVDFPAPEGPMIAVNSPDLNSPDTDLRMSRVSVKRKQKLVNCTEYTEKFRSKFYRLVIREVETRPAKIVGQSFFSIGGNMK